MSPDLETERRIDDMIVDLVARARARYKISQTATAAEACEAVGLGLRRRNLGNQLGFLSERDSAVVVNSEIVWQPRTDFTIYHEVVHHLLNTEEADIIEFYTNVLGNDPRAYDRAIERCCDAGAAEFILPRRVVRAAIDDVGFSVELVKYLAAAHRSSILATAITVALNAPVDCYVVVCLNDISPRWPHAVGLYVEVAVRANGRFPIARGTMIPPDHLLQRAWAAEGLVAGAGVIPFASGKSYHCEHVEARRIGNQVVGILYCTHPPRKGQLRLELPMR